MLAHGISLHITWAAGLLGYMDATASFNIDRQTIERFRHAVLKRHGKLHGCLAKEAALALAARAEALLAEVGDHE